MQSTQPQLVEMLFTARPSASGRVEVRDDVPQRVTTQRLDWPGLRLESGNNNIAAVDDVAGLQHYICLNLDERPVTFEVKNELGEYRRVVLRRGAAWILPANDSISVRINSDFHYARISIDAGYVDRLSGGAEASRLELRRTYGVFEPQISHIVGALIAESDSGNPGGLAFVEALATALSHQLARHAGVQKLIIARARGGLTAAAKRRVLEIMNANLNSNVSVELLAGEVGLSAAHFARAFKETMGVAPHQYLLRLRLEHSRRMLDADDAVLADVAQRAGFADQAHFTRFFKREYGVTPGFIQKNRRLSLAR